MTKSELESIKKTLVGSNDRALEAISLLEAELIDERHRHDRLQDWSVERETVLEEERRKRAVAERVNEHLREENERLRKALGEE